MKINNTVLGIIIFIFSFILFSVSGVCNDPETQIKTSDTIIKISPPKNEISLITKKNKSIPNQVIKYKKPVKVLRDSMIKNDLITAIHIKRRLFLPDKIKVTKIDTLGFITTDIYFSNDLKEIKIDRKGNTEIKPKNKILKKILIIGGSAIIIGISGKIAYDKWQHTHY